MNISNKTRLALIVVAFSTLTKPSLFGIAYGKGAVESGFSGSSLPMCFEENGSYSI